MHLAADRRVGDRLRVAEQILPAALRHYLPPPYDGRVLVFRAGTRPPGTHADAWHRNSPKSSAHLGIDSGPETPQNRGALTRLRG